MFHQRYFNALYALAFGDECNAHYGLKPSTTFRLSSLDSGEIFHA